MGFYFEVRGDASSKFPLFLLPSIIVTKKPDETKALLEIGFE
jgi:hypothetical protein